MKNPSKWQRWPIPVRWWQVWRRLCNSRQVEAYGAELNRDFCCPRCEKELKGVQ